MSVLPRWLIAPFVLVAVAAIVMAKPNLSEKIITDCHGQSDDPEIQQEWQRMQVVQLELVQRMTYKEQLIGDLLASRTNLQTVAEEFLRLNRELPSALSVIRCKYRVENDQELSALNVLDYVKERVSREKVSPQRLEELHREYLARFGHKVPGVVAQYPS